MLTEDYVYIYIITKHLCISPIYAYNTQIRMN